MTIHGRVFDQLKLRIVFIFVTWYVAKSLSTVHMLASLLNVDKGSEYVNILTFCLSQ